MTRKIAPLELWGGVECTVNRVGDAYFDQLRFSGHDARPADLEKIAALGFRTLRYPLLWEKVAPDRLDQCDWRWADQRLGQLRSLGIDPIVGLLHHGSGPRYTSLIDPAFPQKLAGYARQVAEQFPWVTRYTPVNEPLTTARFSGLYGLWYPHGKTRRSFVACLLNQCAGIRRAMAEIRRVQPAAQLVMTEDLGFTTATPTLRRQATHENHRRWLSMDLLMGRVRPGHPFWKWFRAAGADEAILEELSGDPCPPDIFGINHYVTSNRHLDEELKKYPESAWGGNGEIAYADVEAVRVAHAPQITRAMLLRAVWKRYGRPIAITESHLSGSRDEQMRWLKEAWDEAQVLRAEGVDMRAVTLWSLLGAFDWHCLLTTCEGRYEPGVYDLRSPEPRPTALAAMATALMTQSSFGHPALAAAGWWKRPVRALYPELTNRRPQYQVAEGGLLIVGAGGTLGRAFIRVCEKRGLAYTPLTRHALDIAQRREVQKAIEQARPWAVVNTAGFVNVDEAETDPVRCFRENVDGPLALAESCATHGIPLLTFSTDLVFNGERDQPYVESNIPCPLNIYGRTKYHAERAVAAAFPAALTLRTSAFFGPWDGANFLTQALHSLAAGHRFTAADDVWVSPTYVPDLVDAALDLLIDGEKGIWHVTQSGATTWADFARSAARVAGFNPELVEGQAGRDMQWRALRPRYSALTSERGQLLGTLDESITRYIEETRLPEPALMVRSSL